MIQFEEKSGYQSMRWRNTDTTDIKLYTGPTLPNWPRPRLPALGSIGSGSSGFMARQILLFVVPGRGW